MTTPTRSEIRELAQQKESECNGSLPSITCEDSELRENGSWFEARDQLMRNEERSQVLNYLEEMACENGFRLVPKARFEGQQNFIDLKTLNEEILKFGGLFVVANKGCGKTNSLMQIARELRKDARNRVIVFETFPLWMHTFDSMPYCYIEDSDVIKTDNGFESVRHEDVKRLLSQNKDLLICLGIEDIDRLSYFVSKIIYDLYRKRYLKAYKYGLESIKENVIFVCEESQNLFDSSVLNKTVFRRLRKIYSESRNFKIHYLMASQRIQDLNTKIRARARLLVGRVSLDDYELKISRLLRNSQYRREVLEFEVGKFLYADTDSMIRFDKFEQCGKPYECVYDIEKVLAQ